MLSGGYSLLGVGMGLACASNMLDELPSGLAPATFGLLGVGVVLIVVGRRLPRGTSVNPPTPNGPSEPN